MQMLLAVTYREDLVPGDTWLKEQVSRIYKARQVYERARQQLVDGDE
jgi:hypothetical protein